MDYHHNFGEHFGNVELSNCHTRLLTVPNVGFKNSKATLKINARTFYVLRSPTSLQFRVAIQHLI